MEKIRIAEKSLLDQFCAVLDPLRRHFFLAKIPYFYYQINFQSSHLTKKETEDASKRLSSYCMGALNWEKSIVWIISWPTRKGPTWGKNWQQGMGKNTLISNYSGAKKWWRKQTAPGSQFRFQPVTHLQNI